MRTKIALITGGYTAEAEVSLKSAEFVGKQLDASQYEVYTIIITPDYWNYVAPDGQTYPINRGDFTLPLGDKQVIRFDVAFIMVHGSPGEDGRLQGYLDLIGLPYTSCDTVTSALTMNKAYTKAVLADIPGLHLAKSVLLFDTQRAGVSQQVRGLTLPYFVKPNAGGSSIGMTKVTDPSQLDAAIEKAFEAENTGKQVIIEEFVSGREFSVGIYRHGDELVVLPITEVITDREFFDFEAKYAPGLTQEITPANLTADQQQTVAQIIKAIYVRLNCKGMVRVDFFLQKETNHFYFIEINTVPGQTPQSFIPQQVRAAGMTETAFYGQLIEQALRQQR